MLKGHERVGWEQEVRQSEDPDLRAGQFWIVTCYRWLKVTAMEEFGK